MVSDNDRDLPFGENDMNRRATGWIITGVVTLMAGLPSTNQGFAGEHLFEVGVAEVDITPDYPIRLNGFGFRRKESEGVTQRIRAKALAIGSDADKPLILITLDSLGIRFRMVEEVARRLRLQAGILPERVAVTFSHSHTTPKVNGASDNIFSQAIPESHQEHIDRYTRELTDNLELVALRSLENRRPAHLGWSVGTVRFARNRRTSGGPVDHDLPLLVVRDPNTRIRAIYVSYACHCVTLSHNRISGDWSGYAQEQIEAYYPGAIACVSIGAGSDSDPDSGVVDDRVDIAQSQGKQIADEVRKLLDRSLKKVTGPVSAQFRQIELPLDPLPTREQFLQLSKKEGVIGYNAETQLARLDAGLGLISRIIYPIQTWNFGQSMTMVFLAGEVCVDYSHRLKRELDSSRLWINAYSNDFCSYIPSERLVEEGGYGGGAEIPYFALPAKLRPGLEQRIIDEVRRQVPDSLIKEPGRFVVPDSLKQVAESLLDEQLDTDERVKIIQNHPWVAADLVSALSSDLKNDSDEEYLRIPWIWRVSIAAGKRNNDEQLSRLLRVSLPGSGESLRDWQAVVIGGGVINGISLRGIWPKQHLEDLLQDNPSLATRWQRALEQASVMVENELVPSGTRYDALRMIAMESWKIRGDQITKYLKKDVQDELQMGAVSGAVDMKGPEATQALLTGMDGFSEYNRSLAIEGLMRSRDRITALLDAMEGNLFRRDYLSLEQRKRLLSNEDPQLRMRASTLLGENE